MEVKKTLNIDELYKELLIAQLDKNWGKVAHIQLKISRAERESPLEPDQTDVRTIQG